MKIHAAHLADYLASRAYPAGIVARVTIEVRGAGHYLILAHALYGRTTEVIWLQPREWYDVEAIEANVDAACADVIRAAAKAASWPTPAPAPWAIDTAGMGRDQ